MIASEYPITTGYGCQPGYPLNLNLCKAGYGFHKGQDRAMPVGTSVIVNGLQIGLSGGAAGAPGSGASTGPHLHLGKWQGATVVDPQGRGFTLSGATVLDTGTDSVNGNFVRINAEGFVWVYLHLSRIDVTKGQKVEGNIMPNVPDRSAAKQQYLVTLHRAASDVEADGVVGKDYRDFNNNVLKSSEWLGQNDVLLNRYPAAVKEIASLKAQLASQGTKLVKGNYFVE